jgi:hypothetical protein
MHVCRLNIGPQLTCLNTQINGFIFNCEAIMMTGKKMNITVTFLMNILMKTKLAKKQSLE